MGQHLVVILPPLLDVDDEDLLHPKRQLREKIPLQTTGHATMWPLRPDGLEVEPVGRLGPDILLTSSASSAPTNSIQTGREGLFTIPKVQKNP